MHCPKCRGYMTPKKVKGAEADFCTHCGGIWLDEGELAHYAKVAKDFPPPEDRGPARPTDLSCSRCNGDIVEIPYHNKSKVVVDQCTRCRGIFLDRKEFPRIKLLHVYLARNFSAKKRAKARKQNDRREALSRLYKTENPAAKNTVRERNTFLVKVYTLLSSALVITALGAFIGTGIQWSFGSLIALVVAGTVLFFTTLALRRNRTANPVLLFLYAFVEGLTLGAYIALYVARSEVVWIAVLCTALIFFALTAIAFITKKDFSRWRGFLITGLIILIAASIMLIFFSNRLFEILLALAGIVLFSGYILYDTSRILLKYDTSEYIAATLDLYLDVIIMFTDFLRLLNNEE